MRRLSIPRAYADAWWEGFSTAKDATGMRKVLQAEMAAQDDRPDDVNALEWALMDRGHSPATMHAFMSGFFFADLEDRHPLTAREKARLQRRAHVVARLPRPAAWATMRPGQRAVWTKTMGDAADDIH
jgi:hypothetical protein